MKACPLKIADRLAIPTYFILTHLKRDFSPPAFWAHNFFSWHNFVPLILHLNFFHREVAKTHPICPNASSRLSMLRRKQGLNICHNEVVLAWTFVTNAAAAVSFLKRLWKCERHPCLFDVTRTKNVKTHHISHRNSWRITVLQDNYSFAPSSWINMSHKRKFITWKEGLIRYALRYPRFLTFFPRMFGIFESSRDILVVAVDYMENIHITSNLNLVES